MAITIVSNFTTNKFYPSANPINVTVDSNNSGQCNFRYICDLYVNGTKVFTDKVFPDPSTGYGFFQLSRVIQDYIKTYPIQTTSLIFNQGADSAVPTSLITIYCRFGEEYDSSNDCKGTILQYPNLSTSNTFYVFEAAIDYEYFPTFDYTDYLMATSSTAQTKFLTNSPREIEVTYNDSYYLDFMTLATVNTPWNLQLTINYAGGTSSTLGITSSSIGSRKRNRLHIGPYDINKYYNTSVINQNVTSYSFYMRFNTTVISETFTFKVKPPKTFTTRVGFTGLLGGSEQFTFFHRNVKSYDIERKNYERNLQSNSAGVWRYNVGDRGTTTYGVNARQKNTVSSFCSREQSEWLTEMWLSPEVWTWKRPELKPFTAYQWQPNPMAIIGLAFNMPNHGLEIGDQVYLFPSCSSTLNALFTVTYTEGDLVSFGLVYSVYPFDGCCGYWYKKSNPERLPIVISDNTVQVKEKLTRPIEYQLNYQTAYTKNVLRGS